MPPQQPDQQPSPDLVQVDFTLAVGGGHLQASVPVPSAPVNMTHLMPALRILASNVVGAVAKRVNAEGYEISCGAGCAACCRQLVPITLFEADALAEWIRSLPAEQQTAIEARFQRALKQLAESGVLARLDPDLRPPVGSRERIQLALDYLAQYVDCPFLEDETCGIYPIRPLICREHMVTSPPTFCATPVPGKVLGVPMPVRISQALATYSQRVTGQSDGWLPLIFLSAWMRQGMSLAAAPQAPGPQLLEILIRELVTMKSE
jgi:Fe-S-cluster containining protein